MNKFDWVLFSVDPVIFTFHQNELCVLLVRREFEPFKGCWGLPGGRVDKDNCENLAEALQQKLEQKTGLKNVFFEQLATYGAADMDPRGWSVTTAYLALVHEPDLTFTHPQTNSEVKWVPVEQVKAVDDLAFWHRRIILDAFERLRDKSRYTDLPVNFMPEIFTYPMLRVAYEKILGMQITRQSFARRMDSAGIFEDTGLREEGSNRPSPLYRRIDRGGSHIFPGLIKGSYDE